MSAWILFPIKKYLLNNQIFYIEGGLIDLSWMSTASSYAPGFSTIMAGNSRPGLYTLLNLVKMTR